MKKNMISIFLTITLLCFVTVVGSNAADEKLKWNDTWPQIIKIGGGSIGGTGYARASAYANVLKKEFPELEVIVEQTKASVHNMQLANAGQIDIGISVSEVVYEAWKGAGPFKDKKYNNFRLMNPLSINTSIFITKPDSGIDTVSQFNKKYSALGKGSSNDLIARKMFKAFNNTEVEIVNLPTADTKEAFKNGILQGFSYGHPTPAINELSMVEDIKILGLTEEEAKIFMPLHPEFFYPSVIEAGYYKGQDQKVTSFGNIGLALVRADLPEELVYTVLQCLYKHQDVVKSTWANMAKSMSSKEAVAQSLKVIANGVPLHQGAVKFFQESGFDVPDSGQY